MCGRSVIFGNVAKLALQSIFVLIHESTAASFAVIARKPISHLATDELDQGHYGLHAKKMSRVVGTILLNVDNSDNMINCLKMAAYEEKYSLCEVKYLGDEQLVEIGAWGAFVDYSRDASGKLRNLEANRISWCLVREVDFLKC